MMEMTHNSVILAHELVPSETIEANASLVSGFVTAAGGLTSHAAIIARAKGIPYVANIDIKFLKRVEFQSVIVDGSEGLVIVNPTLQTLKKYQEIKKSYLERDRLLQSETHLKGETIDGYEIQVFANLEYPKEVDLSLINQVRDKLHRQGIPTAPTTPLGSMIEVPSSAILADAIADEVDFLSIGTNDLIQYLLAADRMNPHTSSLYSFAHPSVLRLIHSIVTAANNARKPLLLCGECATDPNLVPLLIGLGIRRLSVAARHIPQVKHTIRKWRILEACRLAEGALALTSEADLRNYLTQEMEGR